METGNTGAGNSVSLETNKTEEKEVMCENGFLPANPEGCRVFNWHGGTVGGKVRQGREHLGNPWV